MDRTTTIRASVHDVRCFAADFHRLGDSGGVYLPARSPLHADPGVAVPVSLIGTFGVMYLLGYSIDNLSLMALTIATGFVVDDAIVVIENITRYLETGMKPLAAALLGGQGNRLYRVSISVSLVAVFIPILLMSGYIGRLFREFAVTLSVAIGISMIVSLTTTPMMCAMLLRSRNPERHGRIYQANERAFNWIHKFYEVSLAWVLRHSLIMILATLGTLASYGVSLHRHTQGSVSAAGHWPTYGATGCRSGHLGTAHAAVNGEIRRHRQQRSRCVGRGGFLRRRHAHRSHVRHAQTTAATQHRSGDGSSSQTNRENARCGADLSSRAGFADSRRPQHHRSVPVRPPGRQHRRFEHLGPQGR